MAALVVGRCSRLLVVSALVGVALHIAPIWASAGQPADSERAPHAQGVPTIFGPPPPIPPAVISRDADGRATLRAQRLEAPLALDGVLSEEVYQTVPSATDFVQSEPNAGEPATQKTEVWIFFDNDNFYLTTKCWESHLEGMIVNEMRRDAANVGQNERIGFTLDTFYDRRNGVSFSVNPIGGRMDGQITDERQYNSDWNPIWDLAVGRFDGGWTVEIQIPFKSLRYRPGPSQVWGINVSRHNRWKNEIAYLTPIPPALRGLFQISMAATLVGLDVPSGSRNLEIKPYVTGDVTSVRRPDGMLDSEPGADAGLDVKYGLTQNLTADLTYNTDFAQVEADEQQVNLTRFSLFFPEKREFFLENQGTFAFGGTPATGQAVVGGDMPVLFYSRRIGLNAGREVPIIGGGRLTGRVGRYTLGALNITSDDEPSARALATNFSVVRVKRDVLRRSSVGVLFTGRSLTQAGEGSNQAYGVDGTFAFYDSLAINTYWARTATTGVSGDDQSYRLQLDYAGDRYGLQLERLSIGDHFNPEVGFVRRDNMRRNFGLARFSPRPSGNRLIRKYSWVGAGAYIEDGSGRLETRDLDGSFGIEFHNGDLFDTGVSDQYEYLAVPFLIAPGVILPVGGYDFATARIGYTLGQRRRVSGSFLVESGGFYSGTRSAVTYSRGRVNVTPQFSIEPSVTVNRVDLPEGAFTSRLASARVTYTLSPRMFVSALVQANSDGEARAVNARLRWEYRPGSELFVVYNEQRDAIGRIEPNVASRSFIIKINRLFRL